jgi:hypothetical protein
LPVPDPAFLETLYLVPRLRAIRCDLRGAAALPPFAPGQELRSVAFAGCDEALDLSPLLGLPALEILGGVPRDWTLTLQSPACLDRLPELAGLDTLTWLHLRGCDDLRDLGAFPARPGSLRGLSLYGCPNLTSLDGLDRWQGLAAIEFFDCPQVTSFARLGSLTSLETVSLGLLSQQPRDLSPLAGMPRLRELSLLGHSDFDVSSLAGARDLIIVVPPSARVAGADKLGPESRVTEQAGTP